ncbi:SDR family NAD(P)-dependent oxidoreductase [Alcanivorax sp. 1008]|uniref:SDR family NAD(P)-dependent oxidoreductase n=1 Tax=Alcanivorax sp. 1008 TaxID=2816853 RepID=UPI001DA71E17|nr:SDR family NAD(P)-dependent oxidoreductase [Alcanivorax sp. 1008]MCC1498224.1 SDR family NAD(P)-dependent oxidoreductase [Alcanivorax sp. 1008]
MIAKHLLVTGGAGSFGRAFVEHLLASPDCPEAITVFSRDEHKHYEMAHHLARYANRLRFVIGDIRDASRVDEVLVGVDVVVHAAAMKHVPAAEANPYECIRTNVEGARNLSVAANRHGIKRVVALSSDKAVSPSTIYGASKFAMERVLIQAGLAGHTRFSVVRYANVFASGGSVVPFFLRIKEQGFLPLTDPLMTRFSITMQEGIELVLFSLKEGLGGEIVVPIAPSYRVGDVAMAIAPDAEHRIVGARPGEKMHESMFSLTEAPFVVRNGRYYVVLPQSGPMTLADYLAAVPAANALDKPFEYDSGSNTTWLSIEDIRLLLRSELGVEC